MVYHKHYREISLYRESILHTFRCSTILGVKEKKQTWLVVCGLHAIHLRQLSSMNHRVEVLFVDMTWYSSRYLSVGAALLYSMNLILVLGYTYREQDMLH